MPTEKAIRTTASSATYHSVSRRRILPRSSPIGENQRRRRETRPLSIRFAKAIAGSANGFQQSGRTLFVNLGPNSTHIHVHDVGEPFVRVVPDMLHEFSAAHYFVGVVHHVLENRVLRLCQPDLPI